MQNQAPNENSHYWIERSDAINDFMRRILCAAGKTDSYTLLDLQVAEDVARCAWESDYVAPATMIAIGKRALEAL